MSVTSASSTENPLQETVVSMKKTIPHSVGKQMATRIYLADLFLVKFLVSISSILWGILLLLPESWFTLPDYFHLPQPKNYGVSVLLLALGSYTLLPNFKLDKSVFERFSESFAFLVLTLLWTYLAFVGYYSSGGLSASSVGYFMLMLLSALIFIRYDVHEK